MQRWHVFSLVILLACFAGWPSTDFTTLGRDLIDSTGVVNSRQVDTVLEAGSKLRQANESLNDEQEYYLGRGVSAMILRSYPLLRQSPGLTKYVTQVGVTLAAHSNRPEIFGGYHFGILDTDQVNALSGPGGFIFISRGFLELIPNEEALAGVLAHEIGHIVLGHGVGAISNARLNEALLLLGKEAAASYGPSELNAVSDYFGESVNQVADTLMKTGYSRSQEYEADAFAARLMAQSGYSVKGLTMMLDELTKANAKQRGGWMDTHPSPTDRKASLKLPRQSTPEAAVQKRAARYALALKPPPANPLSALLERFGVKGP
jgi:predicted Zn-dependent protease